ncbi:hypothetical protein AAMO2058_000900500 [Amorphochlora amoebiformis]
MAYRRSRPPGSGRRVIVSRGRVYAPSQFVLGCVVGFILSFVVMVAVLTYFLPAIAKGTMPPMAPTSANTAIPGISGEAKTNDMAKNSEPEVIAYPKNPVPFSSKTLKKVSKKTRIVKQGECFETDVDYYGNDVEGGKDAKTPEECQEQCVSATKCNYFTFEVKRNMCWLKNTKIGRRPGKDLISGPRNCSEVMEIRELYDEYESVTQAQQKVKEAFQYAWNAYEGSCFGQDELRPISRGCINEFGMGLTLVDALDTMKLMNLNREFTKAKNWVKTSLKFDIHKDVSVFETIIRILGGLLSAHALSGDQVFVDKALALAKQMKPAFNGKLPASKVNLKTGRTSSHTWAPNVHIIAEIGSLQIEFWYLSKVTGDPWWGEYGESIIKALETTKTQKPGLYPTQIQSSFTFTQNHISFGALGDSLYEYLLKMWILKGKKSESMYRRMYLQSIQSMMSHLLTKSKEGLWYIAESRGTALDHKMDHLTCFAPGMLALGYHHKVSPDEEVNKKHLEAAENVLETCVQMYMRWPISPEMVRFTPYMTMGTATNFQRPETVESLFVLWQVTKDDKWRKYAWTIFQKFESHLRVPGGYASLNHVGDTNSKSDKMESFLLAETHKYLYLIFDDNPAITIDNYVFNTEAHPVPVPST